MGVGACVVTGEVEYQLLKMKRRADGLPQFLPCSGSNPYQKHVAQLGVPLCTAYGPANVVYGVFQVWLGFDTFKHERHCIDPTTAKTDREICMIVRINILYKRIAGRKGAIPSLPTRLDSFQVFGVVGTESLRVQSRFKSEASVQVSRRT